MSGTAIVILGAPNDERGVLSSIAVERCEQALVEFHQNPAARIIPTGGWGEHFNTTAKPHGQYLREYLLAKGVAENAIVECVESTNTIEDAKLCRPVVVRHGFRKLIVVTSAFHLERAKFLFQREFPEVDLVFRASQTKIPEEELAQRIAHERRALARLEAASKCLE